MSYVKCNETVKMGMSIYYCEVLRNKIRNVCYRIGFDDSNIKWIVFDPYIVRLQENKNLLPIGKLKQDYLLAQFNPLKDGEIAHCSVSRREIYISTKVVDTISSTQINSRLLHPLRKVDFPAEVIIHEITHIQTGRNHNDPEYKRKRDENERRYLSGGITYIGQYGKM